MATAISATRRADPYTLAESAPARCYVSAKCQLATSQQIQHCVLACSKKHAFMDGHELGFEIGKAIPLRVAAGGANRALLVSTGVATTRALAAAGLLEAKGIECTVLHVHTVKPLDTTALLHFAHDVTVVVTIEEHTVIGGLGSAVTDALVDGCRPRLPLIRRLGIPDVFAAKYGNQDELMEMYGLQPPQIAEAVWETLELLPA